MKKIIMLVLSFSLVFSSAAPFIINANAQTNNPQTTQTLETTEENSLEFIKISSDGHEKIKVSDTEKEIVIDVEKNSELDNEKVKLALPKGVTYSGKEEDVSYDEEKNEVTINMNEVNEKVSLNLAIDTEKLTSETIILKAVLEADKKEDTITSNPFKIEMTEKENATEEVTEENATEEVTEENATEEVTKEKVTEEAVIENSSPENETSKESKVKSTKTTKATKDNGNGMTTKEGVPNAPKPDVITHANGTNEADVSTWTEFETAMTNQNINVIHVQEDFYNTRTTAVETNVATPKRNLVIKGNGHIIDFRGIGFRNNTAVAANETIEWKVENLTMYGRNYYGPIHTLAGVNTNNSYGALVYEDVTYVGAQLTASYNWTIDFGGKVDNHSVNSYISPFGDTSQSAQTNQVNIEATDVIFREGGRYNGTTQNAGVFRLQNSGQMTLEDNADVTMTSGGTGGEYQNAALYLQGVIRTGKNASLEVNTREAGNQYGIYIAGLGNGIHAENGSSISVNSKGTYPTINMDSNTSIIVEDSAKLNVDAKGKGNTGYNVINAGSNTTFLIGEKASFNATSDGSGSHAILAFGGNSKFQFADAQNVNLQFTNNSLNTNARLIYMVGQLDVDVQDVKAWNRTNISGNGERDADFHWTPMFGMVTQFSGYNDSVVSASSVMNSEREKYKAEFKPSQFSRLQYSYIEDVETGILNPLTDNITSIDSEVIKGVANPGAYVRLSGDPAIPEPTIPSIVDGADEPELTDDFTVIADEKGNFEVKAKEGMHFTASNNIKAYAFLGGKMDTATVKVLDETAPTGEGVNLSMIYSDQLPKAKQFIINPKDSNPANEGFTYEYKEDYSALATQEGIHDIVIVLGDTAGNKAEIPVKLEVTKDGYGVKADDFSIALSDLKELDTDAKLKEFLLTESKASAYGIVENELQDLTEHLTVQDLANIDQMKAGKYDIKIGFDVSTTEQPDAKASGVFTVTVLNDEEVNPTNPENPGGGEPEEVENGGTGQTGLLKLDYAPSNFAFGEVEFGFDSVKTNAVKTTSDKQWLQVSDHRADEDITNWSVQVSENHELATAAGDELVGSTISIPKGQMYNEKTGEEEVTNGQLTSQKVDITTTPQTIFSADNTGSKIKNTSTNVWQATDVSLSIPGGQEAEFTDYSNTVTWSLVAEPTE